MAAQASPTAVGTLLNGTYRLERVIAEGGMGVVYEAQHLRLPRRFAVKILGKPVDSDTSLATLARFRREAEIASTLQHQHIVEVFDYQVSELGSPYLVMELLEGEDLADRLKRGRVPIAAALRIIQEIAEALDCAHTGGVVHRDLKPANIFLSQRGAREDFVKVLDFGVSKLIDSATLTQEKAMVGTPLYMSPEQAIGTQELTPESDIFSLGAISYEMLTGRRAFAASSIPSILYQIVHGPTPRLAGRAPGLSTAADEVFARVLAKRKEDRYRRATQFAEDLRQALERGEIAHAPVELDDDALAALAARESGTGAITGVADVAGAADTELDSSTRAEEALVAPRPSTAPPGPAPPSVVVEDALVGAARSYTVDLKRGSRGATWFALAVVAAVAVGGGIAFFGGAGDPVEPPRAPSAATARAPTVSPLTAPPPSPGATAPSAAPGATAAAAPTAPPVVQGPVFAPEPIHADVQFVFHVWPRGAEILVDDKKVEGNKVTLRYTTRQHRVVLRAPGYHTLALSAPSTASRVFEMRLDRIVVPPPKKPAPKKPAHDAAPVQDL